MDFAWRSRRQVNELHYVVAAARLDVRNGRFVDQRPLVLGSGTTKSGVCVRNPALAAGPAGQTLLAYENDAGIDRLTVDFRLLSQGR